MAGLGPWFPRAAAIAIVTLFVALNLRGVSAAGGVEVVLVWVKLVVLAGLAVLGLARWSPAMLSQGVPPSGLGAALFGGASVFMAYEGFQLLTYDYEDIERPRVILPRAIVTAILAVIVLYVAVALGTPMLIGADRIVANEEVALAVAGREAAGVFGLIVVTVAAAVSTGSAINSTLFATARLSHQVASGGELPAWLDHLNASRIPDRAVLVLGTAAAVLAAVGSLSALVEAASLAFLGTFAVVGWLAFRARAGHRMLTGAGALGATASGLALTYRLARNQPVALAVLAVLVAFAVFVRPILLRRLPTE